MMSEVLWLVAAIILSVAVVRKLFFESLKAAHLTGFPLVITWIAGLAITFGGLVWIYSKVGGQSG